MKFTLGLMIIVALSGSASMKLPPVSCRPIDIKSILEDVKPQKIDMEQFRDTTAIRYSV